MVLLVAPSPSNCSSLSSSSSKIREHGVNNMPCYELMIMEDDHHHQAAANIDISSSILDHSSNIIQSDNIDNDNNSNNNAPSFISSRQSTKQLEQQSRMDECGAEMDSEDDDCSDSSSIYSDGSSNFDASSIMSLMNESDSLNERRRAMLDLSISKIQTMNASNVAVSLRKSLLIYNMMKSLQRDLDACGVYMCGSLIERGGNGAIVAGTNDVEMLEMDEVEEVDWEQRITTDHDCNTNGDNNNSLCNQRLSYGWSWSTSEFMVNASNDTIQGSEKCIGNGGGVGNGDMFISTSNNNVCSFNNSGNIWSTNNSNATESSAFIDDYLGMLVAWEDENYNPLTNCNLTQAEIMNMFHLPAYHLNNQLVSQA